MRLFVAVDLPTEIRKSVGSFINEIKKKDIVKANFVSPKNMHITLKFLGEVKDVDKIKAKLAEIKAEKFKVSLKGVGAFPSEDYIRVLWVDIDKGAKELKELHEKIGRDKREFSNHMTIARVKAVKDKKELEKFFTDKNFGEFEAKEFKLIKSTLTSNGPVYEEIAKFG